MKKIIACVDGSSHFYSVCDLSSWINSVTNADISLLHVATPHYDVAAKVNFSGSIGFGAKTKLLNDLSKMDEAHGKIEQNKGESILDHAIRELKVENRQNVQRIHLRGSLSEIVLDVSDRADMVIMGRSGMEASGKLNKIGSNLESVVRLVAKPLLIASMVYKPIESLLIAYDGSKKSLDMVNYVANSELLNKLECHLLMIGDENKINEQNIKKAQDILSLQGIDSKSLILNKKNVSAAITDYLEEKQIDLLVMGAYNHSKLRSFILGSITASLINKVQMPVLLFR